MHYHRNFWFTLLTSLVAFSALSQTNRPAQVQKVSVSADTSLQLDIQTSVPVSPQAQVISGPERLVIDIPGAVPASTLHGLALNREEIKRVRVGLFSTAPPVTRIVLDLNSPQWYRITPAASGFSVSLGSEQSNAAVEPESQPTIGWVSEKVAASHASVHSGASLVRTPQVSADSPINGAGVHFANGQLEIHAHNATLSEVLFQIQKQTGAEIAIPAGTEQQRVFVDAGPAPASQVLAELLNGSNLNFVVVGSEADPNALRSVLLSRKTGFVDSVPTFVPPPTSAVVTPNSVPAENPDMNQPLDENVLPPDVPAPQGQPN